MSGITVNHASKCIRVWHDSKQTYFTFSEYGGKAGAMKAAMEFENNLPRKQRLAKFSPQEKSSGESGVVGVGQYVTHGELYGWQAYVTVGPVGNRYQIRQYFGFATYGDEAFDLAVKCRQAMLKKTMPTD